jgi:hypothetical protein
LRSIEIYKVGKIDYSIVIDEGLIDKKL